jgi:hypothetical protein
MFRRLSSVSVDRCRSVVNIFHVKLLKAAVALKFCIWGTPQIQRHEMHASRIDGSY